MRDMMDAGGSYFFRLSLGGISGKTRPVMLGIKFSFGQVQPPFNKGKGFIE
jgi:hypothetical protein